MATIRKQHGHYLEDFRPGSLLRHKGGKTVTDGLFSLFTDFSFTPNPLSKNERYARAYGFRGLVVPPGLVMGIVFGLVGVFVVGLLLIGLFVFVPVLLHQ